MSQEAQTAASQKLTPTIAPWIGILSRVGAISAIVGAWLLLAGWSYLYFYFIEFGMRISSLQIDNRILPLWGLIAAASLPGGGPISAPAHSFYRRRDLGSPPTFLPT